MNRPTALHIDEALCIVCEECFELVPELRKHGAHVAASEVALDAMAACPTGAIRWVDDPPTEREPMPTIDVRSIPPRDRHPLIFDTFDALEPGASFELVNDHDPKPLYHQLRAERDGQLDWTYLVQGPDVWRVRIGRMTPHESAEPELPAYRAHADLEALIGDIQPDSIVSRQVTNDDHVKVTLFGFAAGQELSEHTASKPAILQVLSGEGTFGLGNEVIEVHAGSWAHMDANLPHTVTARTPLVLLLTMIKAPRLA